MQYYLMNKNRKIARIEYDANIPGITNIYEKYDFDYAPLSVYSSQFKKDQNEIRVLNDWFKGRGIPNWRKDLDILMLKLNINMPEELLDKAFGLSLSDQYWINPVDNPLKWEDINFFQNDFKFAGFLAASFSNEELKEKIDLHSPNNTSDGMIKKAWIIENKKRILVKGTYRNTNQEPINEWLVSQICDELEFDYCNYDVDVLDKGLISKCECFINENEEIITANDIYFSKQKDNNTSDTEHYIKILESKGIQNARTEFENMIIIDYLVMNTDRHMKNFGIIRDVNTLEWKRITPIFDTGESMQNNKNIAEMNFRDDTGKLFTNTSKRFSSYLDLIGNPERIGLAKLNEIPTKFKNMLMKYQDVMGMEEARVHKLVDGLKYRIDNLEYYINHYPEVNIDEEDNLSQ